MPLGMPPSFSLCQVKLAAVQQLTTLYTAAAAIWPRPEGLAFCDERLRPMHAANACSSSQLVCASGQDGRLCALCCRCCAVQCGDVSLRHAPCVIAAGRSAVAGRTCPRLPWRGQCANHRAPRPQRLHQQPTAWTHNTARRSPAALLTTNSTQEQHTHCYRYRCSARAKCGPTQDKQTAAHDWRHHTVFDKSGIVPSRQRGQQPPSRLPLASTLHAWGAGDDTRQQPDKRRTLGRLAAPPRLAHSPEPEQRLTVAAAKHHGRLQK